MAALCSSLCLFGSGIKAAGNIESLQNCSALTGSNVELGEFIGEELERARLQEVKRVNLERKHSLVMVPILPKGRKQLEPEGSGMY